MSGRCCSHDTCPCALSIGGFPEGDREAVEGAETREQCQRQGCLCCVRAQKERDPGPEKHADLHLFRNRIKDVAEALGAEEIDSHPDEQKDTPTKFVAAEGGQGRAHTRHQHAQPHPQHRPPVLEIEAVAGGAGGSGLESERVQPAVGAVDEPDGRGEQPSVLRGEGKLEGVRKKPLPEHPDERRIERQDRGPRP